MLAGVLNGKLDKGFNIFNMTDEIKTHEYA